MNGKAYFAKQPLVKVFSTINVFILPIVEFLLPLIESLYGMKCRVHKLALLTNSSIMITPGLEPGIRNLPNKDTQMRKLFWGVFATFISVGLILIVLMIVK